MHTFLTGDIQVGKSTIINRYLERKKLKIGGFKTVVGMRYPDGSDELHIVRADGTDTFRQDNLVICRHGIHAQRGITVHTEAFDLAGSELLKKSAGCDIIIMDELGPKEEEAQIFQRCVLALINGDIPILGVVMKRESPFLDKVRNHLSVKMLEVTKDNREDILRDLLGKLKL